MHWPGPPGTADWLAQQLRPLSHGCCVPVWQAHPSAVQMPVVAVGPPVGLHPIASWTQVPGPPGVLVLGQQTRVAAPHGFWVPVWHGQPTPGWEGSVQAHWDGGWQTPGPPGVFGC